MRGIGAVDALQALFPDILAGALPVVSHLGDPAVAVGLLVLVYWFGDRQRAVRLMGVVAGGLALALLAKTAFALPRPAVGPPAPVDSLPPAIRNLYRASVYTDGYGFPSGHTVTATVTYGTLAGALDWRTPRQRYAIAAGLVVVVALTRLLLGVHYLVDVVAGAVLGIVYLVAARRVLDRFPATERTAVGALGVGCVLGLLAVAVGGFPVEELRGVGALVGGLVGYTLPEVPRDPWPVSAGGVGRAAAALGVFGTVAGVGVLVDGPLVRVLSLAVGTALVLGFPALLVAAGVDLPPERP